MDWKETGHYLREIYQINRMQRCRCKWCLSQGTARAQRENYWIALVSDASRGDPSGLVKHLRSRRKITRYDRSVLAELLEGQFTGEYHRKKKGRPQRYYLRSCAEIALRFYGYWKELNRQHGINDRGRGDEMKDYACLVAIELFGTPTADSKERAPTFEEVRTMMDRPARRRGDSPLEPIRSSDLAELLSMN
jgi:hypothetical protein